MAVNYEDIHGDFFYRKDESGLGSVIRLQKVRKLVREALNEMQYVFPRCSEHQVIISSLDNNLRSSVNILDDVLQKKNTKKPRKGQSSYWV